MRKTVYSIIEVVIMRKRSLIGPLLVFLLGLVGMVLSVSAGSIRVFLIFIVPVFVAKGLLAFISIVLFFTGAVWMLIVYMKEKFHNAVLDESDGKVRGKSASTTNGGGILFIGPIPIVFGDKEIRSRFPGWWILLLIAISVFVLSNIVVYLLL